ncbi:MAG: cytochrome-c oxidase, cbb3-type subunit III [Sterolibacterium sp.]|nr:cytochrome-c oxidase, cbb3-type subunit III [Sterolibacterium sp.]
MSNAWAWWVILLIVFNLGLTFFLFLWAPWAKVPVLPDGTTGHSWAHGAIREGLHRLPGWWLFMSFAMFIGAFGYFVLYPGFGNFAGTLGWTSTQEHDQAARTNATQLTPVMTRLAKLDVAAVAADPQGRQLGARLFIDNCAACHGREGRGNMRLGAPDLTDGDWLYGGADEAILSSIRDGRNGVMPAWESLGEQTVNQLAAYVLSLSGQVRETEDALAGKTVFATTCSACHGTEGKGNPLLGAPNLTDGIWLHGGRREAIRRTIRDGRQGHMPAWSGRLNEQEIHVLAGYVHHLAHPDGAARR